MTNDVRRAYFHAKATKDIYIEIPSEDEDAGLMCSVNWSSAYTEPEMQLRVGRRHSAHSSKRAAFVEHPAVFGTQSATS